MNCHMYPTCHFTDYSEILLAVTNTTTATLVLTLKTQNMFGKEVTTNVILKNPISR
jgi:hypothetical protein